MDRTSFPTPLRHVVNGLKEVLDESCGNDVEDELELILGDNPGTTIGTTFYILHGIFFPLLVSCGF